MAQPEFLRRSLLIALAPLLVGLLVFLFLYAVKIAKWVDWRAAGREGVATVKAVPIRGAEQYLFIRGHDRSKPVLLFLPGGPGESVVPLERIFSRMLEKHFVVAQVEFGVGRAEPYRDAPTIHEFAADAEQMVDALRASYGERPVYLAGSSLGAIQALLIAQRSPEKIAAVVTIGQPVDWAAGNELAAAELARRAAARNDRETLSALAALPRRLVLDDDPLMIDFAAVKRQRALLAPYGMETVLTRHTPQVRWFSYLTAPNHTMSQACNLLFQDGNLCSHISRSPQWWRQWHRLLPGIVKFDAARDVPELKVPYVAIVGSDDWVCPASLTKAYVALLRAPSKRLIELRDAGHYAYLDRPTAVQEAIVDALVE